MNMLAERTPEARKAYLEGYAAALKRALEAAKGYRLKHEGDEWDRGCNAGTEMISKEIEGVLKHINIVIEQETHHD